MYGFITTSFRIRCVVLHSGCDPLITIIVTNFLYFFFRDVDSELTSILCITAGYGRRFFMSWSDCPFVLELRLRFQLVVRYIWLAAVALLVLVRHMHIDACTWAPLW
jgi:hypothetical protein